MNEPPVPQELSDEEVFGCARPSAGAFPRGDPFGRRAGVFLEGGRGSARRPDLNGDIEIKSGPQAVACGAGPVLPRVTDSAPPRSPCRRLPETGIFSLTGGIKPERRNVCRTRTITT